MKKLLTISLLVCGLFANAQTTNLVILPNGIVIDNCEQAPSSDWMISPKLGYAMFTPLGQNSAEGGNWFTPDPYTFLEVSTTYARKGVKSYHARVTKDLTYQEPTRSRAEVMWMSNPLQTSANAWKIAAVSVLIAPSFQFENRPTQIAFDIKASPDDLQTPFWLGIMNGQYYIDGYFVGGTVYLGAVTKGVWEDWTYERNWYAGPGHPNNIMFGASDGYQRLYRNGVLVWSKTGVNWFGRPGDAPVSRIQHGPYKWVWMSPDGQGWGEGVPQSAANAVMDLYYDQIMFAFANNSKEQIFEIHNDESSPTNQPPIVAYMDNETVAYPGTSINTIEVDASDADGTIASYLWSQVSGPNTATITNGTTDNPTFSSMIPGTYVFRVTVTDDDNATGFGDVSVTVNSITPPTGSAPVATNQANIATPIPDMIVKLPTTDTTFKIYSDVLGSGYVGEQLIFKIGGPTGGTPTRSNQQFDNPTEITINLASLQEGTYTYRFQMTDNTENFTVNDTFNVVVQPATNVAPTVNAGTHVRLGWPDALADLNGSASDVDGSILSVRWDKFSGPPGGIFSNQNASYSSFNALTPGKYILQFTATDNQGKTATDTVSVTVESITANVDTFLFAPSTSFNLRSTASALGATYAWTQLSGPNIATFVSGSSANTTVTGLTTGEYIFKVRATWGNVHTEDQVKLNVIGGGSRELFFLKIEEP